MAELSTQSPQEHFNMITAILSFLIGFVAGIYRNEIADKARQLYIKITERP